MVNEKRRLICGSRDWNDVHAIEIDLFYTSARPDMVIVGGARGADAIAERLAKRADIPTEVYKADWKRWGQGAGPIRNSEMLERGKPTEGYAYSDSLDYPRSGTRHMCRIMIGAGVPVRHIYHLPDGSLISRPLRFEDVAPAVLKEG